MRFYRFPETRTRKSIKISDLDWYAVRTPPPREFVAEEILEKFGYAIICPVLGKKMRVSRHTKKRRDIEVPLLPSYVLMGFKGDPDWHKLFSFGRRQNLVVAVCGFGGEARVIPERSMNWIARMMHTANVDVVDAQEHGLGHQGLAPGDRADVLAGPFQGHVVKIDELSGSRVTCLVELFGGKQKTKIAVDNLQRVA